MARKARKKNKRIAETEEESIERKAKLKEKLIEKQKKEKQQYSLRMVMLRDTGKLFEYINRNVNKISIREDKLKKWNKYIKCDNLPSTKKPYQIRGYLYRWTVSLLNDWKNTFSWILSVDERSALNQDYRIENQTAVFVQAKQPNLCEPYSSRIIEVKNLLDELEDILRSPLKYEVDDKTYNEIKLTKDEIRAQLRESLDYLTFLILQDIECNMELISPTKAIYNFNSDTFSLSLYTFRDVPLPPLNEMKDTRKIKLNATNTDVSCPKSILFDRFALRSLWIPYDHFSDCSPTYKLPDNYKMPELDLISINNREWDKMEKLKQEKLENMKKARKEYEWKMEQLQQKIDDKNKDNQEKSKSVNKKAKKGSKKKQKKIIEPPIVNENTIVEISSEYRELESKITKQFYDSLEPSTLMLEPNEVNMRNSQILGGLVIIDYLHTPHQGRTYPNNMRLRLINTPSETIKYAHYHQNYKPFTIPSNTSLEPIEIENLRHTDFKQFANLIEISIELPKNVCWWTQPFVCRWQPWEQSEQFQSLEPELQYFNLHYDEIMAQKSNSLFSSNYQNNGIDETKVADIINNFNLNNIPETIRLHCFIKKHILPRLTATYKFDCEFKEDEEILENEEKRRKKLQLEYDEEKLLEAKAQLKVKQEKLRWKEKKLEEIQNTDNKVSESNGKETQSLHSSLSSSTSSSASVKSLKEETTLKFRKFIQGTVAKELFLHLDHICPLKIRKEAIEYTKSEANPIEKYMLSDLLQQIENYNKSEAPYFKDPPIKENKSETKVEPLLRSRKLKSKKQKNKKADEIIENKSKTIKLIPHHKGKWTMDGIYVQDYDENLKIITFRTTDLGTFGFGTNKFYNLPLKNWELQPHPERCNASALLHIYGTAIKLEIEIMNNGFNMEIIEPVPKLCPIKIRKKYFENLNELKEYLQSIGMNIFPEIDSKWYIPDILCNKHEAMCQHTYKCISYFCLTHHFKLSQWNRFAQRRIALIFVKEIIESTTESNDDNFMEIKVTPMDAYIVRTENKPGKDNESEVSLKYFKEPEEQEFSADLYNLLASKSIEKSKRKQMNTNAKLQENVSELLQAINPLSFA